MCTIIVIHYCMDNHQLLIILAPAVINPLATYWPRNHNFCLPHLHFTPHYGGSHWNIAITFSTEKLEYCGYSTVKKF